MTLSKKLENYEEQIEKVRQLFNQAYLDVMNKENKSKVEINFSNRFSKFNGKLVFYKTKNMFELRLSKEWENISSEIFKGLLEELISGLFKKKHYSLNVELYRRFIRNLDIVNTNIEAESNAKLLESFNRVNEKYFNNRLDPCIVKFGKESRTQLGLYNYHSDSITISKILEDAPQRLLDYVMYHEMVHKYLKLSLKGKTFHSKEFRELESKYEGWPEIEKELSRFVQKKRRENKKKSNKFTYLFKKIRFKS